MAIPTRNEDDNDDSDSETEFPDRTEKRSRRLRRWDWWESMNSPTCVTAPMVDQSELAFRMLTRSYGAGLAYTPMLNSKNFAACKIYRKNNFDTAEGDDPLIAQFCGDSPELLVESARYIQNEVSAVDVNFGCPQGIAKRGHYGSHLLNEPVLCTSLIVALVSGLECPVTAKMRIVNLNDPGFQDTVNLVSQFESAGVDMVCLHGRTKEMNKQTTGPADWEACRVIVEKFKSFPIVSNGGIETYSDIQKCIDFTSCAAVMSSEAILEKPNLFDPCSIKSQDELAREYLNFVDKYPLQHRFEARCVKSHMFRILFSGLQRHVDLRTQLATSHTVAQISSVVDELTQRRKLEPSGKHPDLGWYVRHRNKNETDGAECVDTE